MTATAADVPWRVRGGREGPEDQSGPSLLPCLLSLPDPRDRDPGGRGRCRTHGRADAPTGPCKTAQTRFRTSAHRHCSFLDQEIGTEKTRREKSRFLRFFKVGDTGHPVLAAPRAAAGPGRGGSTAEESAARRLGGTPEANSQARADAWSKAVAFLERTMKDPVRPHD